jgi:hypothetical protein
MESQEYLKCAVDETAGLQAPQKNVINEIHAMYIYVKNHLLGYNVV